MKRIIIIALILFVVNNHEFNLGGSHTHQKQTKKEIDVTVTQNQYDIYFKYEELKFTKEQDGYVSVQIPEHFFGSKTRDVVEEIKIMKDVPLDDVDSKEKIHLIEKQLRSQIIVILMHELFKPSESILSSIYKIFSSSTPQPTESVTLKDFIEKYFSLFKNVRNYVTDTIIEQIVCDDIIGKRMTVNTHVWENVNFNCNVFNYKKALTDQDLLAVLQKSNK
jgi:hypothetical protein